MISWLAAATATLTVSLVLLVVSACVVGAQCGTEILMHFVTFIVIIIITNYYLHQGGHILPGICLSVCLSVINFT